MTTFCTWKRFWVSSWGPLVACWGHLKGFLWGEGLGGPLVFSILGIHIGHPLKNSWGHLGPSSRPLGSWAALGPSWGPLGAVLAMSWAHIGHSWGNPGSLAHLAPLWGLLGRSGANLRALLGAANCETDDTFVGS